VTGPINDGQTFRYRFPVKNSSGVLANAGTVTVTITLPDGTTDTPAVVNTSTGLYDIAYLVTMPGLHQVHCEATGAVLGTEVDVWEDSFVAEPASLSFIGVDEAISHLRAETALTSDVNREKVRTLCIAVSNAVELDLDLAIAWRTVTETFDGGRYELNLSTKPPRARDGGAIEIIEVSENGTVITDYILRKARWQLMRGSSSARTLWAGGYENISVEYSAGCARVPPVVRRVALNTFQTAWQASQQAEHPFLDEVARRASLATLSTDVLPSLSRVEQAAYRALRSGYGFAA
jgi:hypothetical protein